MQEAFVIAVAFVAGAVTAAAIAVAYVRRRFERQLREAESRASGAEGKSAALEAAARDSRVEVERVRGALAAESEARVKAETQLRETVLRLDEERKLLDEAKARLTDTFKALAGDALSDSAQSFLKLAKETFERSMVEARGDLGRRQEAISGLVAPLTTSLRQFEEHVRGLEKNRQESYAGLVAQLRTLSSGQQQLQKETGNLVTALRAPQVRGRWGELTLRRVVELAGMSDHCDFTEQVSAGTDTGRVRPDMLVHLAGDREIVVDAKVALDAYLDAVAADTEVRRGEALARHAAQVRTHMSALAGKAYWEQFTKAPEFVVMFIPGESFFAAAVDVDRSLLEDGLAKRVVLATPTTLIAVLHAVAYSWRQEQIARNAQAISDLGKQLYDRMRVLAEHLADVGKGLEKATAAYNNAVGSIEHRILPAARRFKELGAAAGDDIPALQAVDTAPRALAAPAAEGQNSSNGPRPSTP